MVFASLDRDRNGLCTPRIWVTFEDFEREMQKNAISPGDIEWAHCFEHRSGTLVATYRKGQGIIKTVSVSG